MACLAMGGRPVVGGIQSGIVFASAIAVAVFIREEQNKGQIINRSLPISHFKAVCARYLSISLFVVSSVLYGLFFWLIIAPSIHSTYLQEHFLHLLGDRYVAPQHFFMAHELAVGVTIAIGVPLIYRYGTFWRIVIGYLIVFACWSRTVTYLQECSHSIMLEMGLLGSILFAMIFPIAIVTVSIQLSIRFYGRKQL
jgi:hypothetical protein